MTSSCTRAPRRGCPAAGRVRVAGAVIGDLADLTRSATLPGKPREFGRFDAVIHNAGVLHRPEAVTVNTVAPYMLTALMDKPARLIYLSSSMHRTGSTDLRRLTAGTASYDDTKLWVTALSHGLRVPVGRNHEPRGRPRMGSHPHGRSRAHRTT